MKLVHHIRRKVSLKALKNNNHLKVFHKSLNRSIYYHSDILIPVLEMKQGIDIGIPVRT